MQRKLYVQLISLLLYCNFVSDLISDWSSKVPPDIAYFVPYEWEFKFHFRDYELICIVNEHNWIDCTSDNQNGMILFHYSPDSFDC